MNLYMVFGGTNWGQLAEPGVYTSYDYGAIIREDRRLRDKYYELKLIIQFLKVSPAYLTSTPWELSQEQQTAILQGTQGIALTVLEDTAEGKTKFYIVRQREFSTFKTIGYSIKLETSIGSITVPKPGTLLQLQARDSNIIVVDYVAGESYIFYSTAEIYTWKIIDDVTYIFVYGDEGERHEIAFKAPDDDLSALGASDTRKWTYKLEDEVLTFQFSILENGESMIIKFGKTAFVVLDREVASKTWVLETEPPTVVKGGYLIRSAKIEGPTLHLNIDLTQATRLHVLAPKVVTRVTFNSKSVETQPANPGWFYVMYTPDLPDVSLPDLSKLEWVSLESSLAKYHLGRARALTGWQRFANSLPEIQSSYDDTPWVTCSNTHTPNAEKPATKEILYASDYGFHSGNILWRGHFEGTGGETEFWAEVQGYVSSRRRMSNTD
ncbi:Beta-galactosidase [Dactylella cylindrospora]|nr:Beta-galactosidase [Dactylella cylindrospora]